MGSKNRIAKNILPIMLKDRKEGQSWVEPFVGGANIIDKVDGLRIGADSNNHVISALKLIRDNKTPENDQKYSEIDYKKAAAAARLGQEISEVDSYALIAFSFGAKWIGGWSRGMDSNGQQRDYVSEQHRASEKQKALLQDVSLINSSYMDLNIPADSIIYCDPPYENTTGYKDKFNHVEFWQWCRDKSKEGHTVFISEYNAPDDFECVWEKEIQSGLNVNTSKKGVERLFTI